MMKPQKFQEKTWYNAAVAACIAVAFYVLLTHFSSVLSGVKTFIGYFRVVILGVVFAYVLHPLTDFFYYRLFGRMKVGGARWTISVILTVVVALLVLLVLLVTLVPQLVQSIATLTDNLENYGTAVKNLIQNSPLQSFVDDEQLETLTSNAFSAISGFLSRNGVKILNSAANSGKGILSSAIALILAVYLLMDRNRVLSGLWRLVHAILRQETTEKLADFLLRCDTILVSYLGQTLLDSLIVGVANAVIMTLCGMQYVGLISVLVGVTNLIPNFGPVIGIGIGAFVLLLVDPIDALIFILIGIVIQFIDAYILKPKLFSNSLGVSGLLILIASLVLGNMFGVIGMLLAIPAAAILSFIYHDYFLPGMEARRTSEQS